MAGVLLSSIQNAQKGQVMAYWLKWFATVVMIGFVGGVVGALMFGTLGGIVSGFGAIVGGVCAAGMFGRPDSSGIGIAAMGALLSTAIGAGVIGALFGGFAGAFEAAGGILAALVIQWPVGLAWCAMMTVVHLTARAMGDVVAHNETECSAH